VGLAVNEEAAEDRRQNTKPLAVVAMLWDITLQHSLVGDEMFKRSQRGVA